MQKFLDVWSVCSKWRDHWDYSMGQNGIPSLASQRRVFHTFAVQVDSLWNSQNRMLPVRLQLVRVVMDAKFLAAGLSHVDYSIEIFLWASE